MEIRGRSISYCSFKKRNQYLQEKKLIKLISQLENSDVKDLTLIDEHKQELQKIRQDKLKGSMIRSKVNWLESGEKPSKYFLNLEKRNFTNKIVPKVQKENGDLVTSQPQFIQKEHFEPFNLM